MELNNEFEVDRPIEEAWVLLTDVERIAPCLPGAQLEEIEGEEYRGSVKVKVGPITANYKGKATFIEKDDVNHKAVLRAEGRDARQGNANATITATLVPAGAGTKVTVNTDLAVTGKVAQFGRGVMAEVSEKLLKQFVQNLETKVLAQPTSSVAAATADADAPGAAAPVADAPASSPATESATPSTTVFDTPSSAPATPAAASATPSSASATPASDSVSNNGASSGAATVRKIAPSEPVEPVDLLGATGAPMLKRLAPVLGALLALLVASRWLRRRRG